MSGNMYVRQHDVRDCAAACLASVCNLYHVRIPMVRMRELLRVDKNGSSLYAMQQVAKTLGFHAEALQGEWKEFYDQAMAGEIQLPAICHVIVDHMEHFIIVKKITPKYVAVFDPGKGHMRYLHEEFASVWTGFLLEIRMDATVKHSDMEEKKSGRYLAIVKRLRWKFVWVLVMSLLAAGVSVFYSLIYQQILDKYMTNGISSVSLGTGHLLEQIQFFSEHLSFLFRLMLIIVLAQFVIGIIRGLILTHIEKVVDVELSGQYVQRLLRLPFFYFQQWKTGEIMSRFQDMEMIRNAISGSVLTITFESVMAVGGAILLCLVNRSMFLIIVLMMMLYFCIVMGYRKPLRKTERDTMEYEAGVTSCMKEGIDGIMTIKLFSREKTYECRMMDRVKLFIRSCCRINILQISQNSILEAVQGIGIVLVLWRGTVCVMEGNLSLGTLFLFVSLMDYFISPLKSLISFQPQLQQAWIAADRLNDVLEATPESTLHTGEGNVSDFHAAIRFSNVSFRYGYRRWILQNLNLTIFEGEHVGISGENGAGKSTLARLLVGMYEPDAGEILLGEDKLSTLSLEAIRNHIAYVPQDAAFLTGTLSECITFGCKTRPEKKIFDEICAGCFLGDIVENTAFGYEWIISENGTNISGGQRQRLAIARALLARPDILILDEATSQIDRTREHEILDFVFRYMKGKTVIVITHEDSILAKCDRVLNI